MNATAPGGLAVRDLRTVFDTPMGPARAVDGVSFDIAPGETLALVGESGCGKSVTALSILRLLPGDARIAGGSIHFAGQDLLALEPAAMRQVRGRQIGMVFQDPVGSLNPVYTCGEQVAEVFRVHMQCGRQAARDRALDMLRRVHLPDAERVARCYPHEISGGMCQRVMLAMALACGPSLLIADEPTTALDVTIQAQICDLLLELRAALGMAVLLISHDLGLVAGLADRVALMYAGRIVEQGPAAAVFAAPRHPYTLGLLRSSPGLTPHTGRLPAIPGQVPHPAELPAGCHFQPRCSYRIERCVHEDPWPRPIGPGHEIACLVDVGERP